MIKVKTSTKVAFFLALTYLLICTTMLAGTTFALFTENETINANRIISGTLDMELEKWDKTVNNYKGGYTDATFSPMFEKDIWAPGHMEVSYMKVINTGTLAVKYELNVLAKETPYVNEHGQTVNTSDFLECKIICNKQINELSDVYPDRQTVLDTSGYDFDLKSPYEKGGFILEPGQEGYFAFMIYMPIEVTTVAAPDGDIEAEKSRITITLDIVGTQAEHEADGFGNIYYDEHFTYPIITSAELQRDLALGGIISFAHDVEDISDIENVISKPTVIDLNRSTFTVANKNAFVINNGADVQLQGKGVINSDGYCFDVQDGKLTILNGTYNGGINVGANGELAIRGGTFIGFDPTEYVVQGRNISTSSGENGETVYTVS